MEKVGIVFGCFIPLHRGHMSLIESALKENDEIILAVCGYEDDRGKDFISFSNRFFLIQDIYGSDTRIHIVAVNDKKIGLTGTFSRDAWMIWGQELFTQAGMNQDECSFTWYTGEGQYVEKLQSIYTSHVFKQIDRSIYPVSGTAIRQNYKGNREWIHPHFYSYLERKFTVK